MAKSTRTKSQTKKQTPEPAYSETEGLNVGIPEKLNPTNRGIFILALGHPFYGRMAFNLACSIKNEDPAAKITLGYCGDALKELFRYNIAEVFDQVTEVPIECMLKRGHTEYLRAKLHFLHLSPYDYTLFLDADTIWLPGKPVSRLMELMMDEQIEFSIQASDKVDMADDEAVRQADSTWCHPRNIKSAYGIQAGFLYTIFSEFIWAAKTERNLQLFEAALEIYDNPKVEFLEFAGGIPDELPIAIAMAILGIEPHQPKFLPIYWEHREKLQLHNKPDLLNADFWLYSIGGKVTPKYVKSHYNFLADVAFQKRGLRYPYHVVNKREFLPERSKI